MYLCYRKVRKNVIPLYCSLDLKCFLKNNIKTNNDSFFVSEANDFILSTNLSSQLKQVRSTKKTRIPRAGTASRVENPNAFSVEAVKLELIAEKPARDEYYVQDGVTSTKTIEIECEDTFHTIANAVFYAKRSGIFEEISVEPPVRDEILLCDVNTRILFHFEEPMTELLLKFVRAQHERVDSRQTAALQYFIKRIFKDVMSLPENISQIGKAIIDNPGYDATINTWEES